MSYPPDWQLQKIQKQDVAAHYKVIYSSYSNIWWRMWSLTNMLINLQEMPSKSFYEILKKIIYLLADWLTEYLTDAFSQA